MSRNPLVAIAAILFAAAAIAGIVARNALVAVILAVAAKPATTPASMEPAQT